MKSAAAFLIASSANAAYAPAPANYEYAPAPAHYHHQQYAPAPAPVQYVEAFKPEEKVPYPYVHFSADDEEESLKLPSLGDYHCFLTGAPWTKCGRRSLTSYFLDQCMAFHFLMTKNVDGICGEGHEDETDYAKAYLTEKCLQKSFGSIITATVQCLTENMVRIQYIEHYSKYAAKNPIAGPTLYLKKMHEFIEKVMDCTDGEEANFPTLYKTSSNYNPNSPFYLDSDNNVALQQYTNGEASGMDAFTLGDHASAKAFLCSNVEYLVEDTTSATPEWSYKSVPGNPHFSSDACPATYSAAADKIGAADLARNCVSLADGVAGTGVSVELKGTQFATDDMSLRSLYDAVHPYEADTTALRRPKTIAEIAVTGAGMVEQPILEGYGIMYFCAFYACKANNGGNVDGTCFPAFSEEEDFPIASQGDYADFKTSSDRVTECIDNNWLTSHDIALSAEVSTFKSQLQRSYLCMAEKEIVRFMDIIVPGWDDANDAVLYVYGRHLAEEKCYEEKEGLCQDEAELYELLLSSLKSLEDTCEANKISGKAKAKADYLKANPKRPTYSKYAASPKASRRVAQRGYGRH